MSSYDTYYNNLTTDLDNIVDLQGYDSKKLITNWQTHSSNLYRAESGYVSMLFKEGKELGAAQSGTGDLNVNDEWTFVSADNLVYYYNDTTSPNDMMMEAGEDFVDLKTRVAQEQAERIRSYVGRPILPRKDVGTDSASSRNWDWLIINANATLTCAALVKVKDAEFGAELEKRIIDPETGLGTLDLLKAGQYHLWNESEFQRIQVRDVSLNGSTTSAIVDVKGIPTVEWDILKVQIQTGGTLSSGSASSVTFSTWGKNDTGIKRAQIANADTVTGGWNYIGHGCYVRWSAGVLTASDEWEIEVNGMAAENAVIKTSKLVR